MNEFCNENRAFERNLEIDRLRAVAILITMYVHLDFVMLGASQAYTASKAFVEPHSGVYLFFVISGFVIAQSLIPDLDRSSSKSAILLAFWCKRSTRILPLALTWIIIPLILCLIYNSRSMFNTIENNITGALAAALFVFNFHVTIFNPTSIFGVYWSLSVEEQFYLLFPPFLLLIIGYQKRMVGLALAAIALAFLPSQLMAFRADGIIYGVLLFLLLNRRNGLPNSVSTPKIAKDGRSLWLTLITTIAILALFLAGPLAERYGLNVMFSPLIPSLISAFLVWVAVGSNNHVLPVSYKLSQMFDWVGTRSFGLYLIHIPAFMIAGETTWRLQMFDTPLGRGVISAMIMIAITELSYQFMEYPIRNWGKKKAKAIMAGAS